MKDKLGRDLTVGSVVAATYLGNLMLFNVEGYTPQKVKLRNRLYGLNKEPTETVLVLVDGAEGLDEILSPDPRFR